jgi:hypothetical protein
VLLEEAAMTFLTKDCHFRLVSDTGQRLIDAGNSDALIDFTRQMLACPRLRDCEFGDYCTILAASLLSEHGRHPHDAGRDSAAAQAEAADRPLQE